MLIEIFFRGPVKADAKADGKTDSPPRQDWSIKEAGVKGTECSLNIVFFPKILEYSGLCFSGLCQCVYTHQAGRTPALQQNWQSSEKSQNFHEKHNIYWTPCRSSSLQTTSILGAFKPELYVLYELYVFVREVEAFTMPSGKEITKIKKVFCVYLFFSFAYSNSVPIGECIWKPF